MKIYSITEIVKATNDLLIPEAKFLYKNSKKEKLPPETEKIIIETEKSIQVQKDSYPNNEEPLVLTDETYNKISNKINSHNYNIKIKPKIKDHMINELYLYLKKKVRKNTLSLIIDEQLEIKNLKNKIEILKLAKNNLKNDYQVLKNDYNSSLINNKNLEINKTLLKNEIKELEINNRVLQTNLNQVIQSKEQAEIEILELKNRNQNLQNDLNKINKNKGKLDLEVEEIKDDLNKTKLNLKENIEKSRIYEINNHELKDAISRNIINSKKTQEKLNLSEQTKNSKLDEQTEKIKFYQEENIRLSSELLSAQEKNQTIKVNLKSIETEKEKISNKIKELNNSIGEKTNIIPSTFVKENAEKAKKNEILNDHEQKNLDEVIKRIFAKL